MCSCHVFTASSPNTFVLVDLLCDVPVCHSVIAYVIDAAYDIRTEFVEPCVGWSLCFKKREKLNDRQLF